jgi:hypothetical protein
MASVATARALLQECHACETADSMPRRYRSGPSGVNCTAVGDALTARAIAPIL